jgi:hypothetical protein
MRDGAANHRAASQPWQQRLLFVGIVAACACAFGAWLDLEQFLRSWLFAWLAWLGIAVGSLGLWMIHNLTGGAWGHLLRRSWEAASRTLPLLIILFVPLGLGVRQLFPWATMDEHALGVKAAYLNVPFFLARATVYFAIWLGAALLLQREQRRDDNASRVSGPGLVLVALAVTFAAVDWIMSLEPDWFSTIIGALIGAGYLVAALAFAIGVAATVRGDETGPGETWNDLGNLLLAFVMLWTYMAFSQLLLIWSGNLPEEITWYLRRTVGGWQWIGLALAIGYFALPFCLLLSRDMKRNPARLRLVAFLVVGMSVIDHFWLIAPAFSPGHLFVHWLDVAACVSVGSLWLGVFLRQLHACPPAPLPAVHAEEAAHV